MTSVSAFPYGVIAQAGDSDGVVTVTGDSFNTVLDGDVMGPWDSRMGWRVNSDGTIDYYSGIISGSYTYTQINASTDWIIPNSDAPDDYEVRLTVTGAGPNFSSASTGTWLALTTSRQWIRQETTLTSQFIDWLIEIRKGSGSVLDSAAHTGTITNGL